ncbi:MAG: gamma-glutamyl-gamma-aminobutyrate hydrolase family protein [Firmicutes bacterium]|nr:gamma-glutamyl-gamma-aminobutyrate hydrolase family protein [Bacillota bacterium]
MRPIIGITPAYDTNQQRLFLRPPYLEAVARAGGLPLILPLTEAEVGLEELIPRLHGLLLTGGGDIDPGYFGEEVHPRLREVQPLRDSLEMKLVPLALREGIPLLGICRGIQVMNAAMGGSLYQDLPSQRPGLIQHDQWEPRERPTHLVTIRGGSRLAAAVSPGCSGTRERDIEIRVNSIHHQAVKETAGCFIASAWSPDGLIEGIEAEGHPFALGVQWHPEDLAAGALFSALVETSRRRVDRYPDRF